MSTTNPKCCGQESRLVVQSTNLQYLFCDVCKEEVKPYEFTPPDNYDELLTAFEKMLTPTNGGQSSNSTTNCSSCGAIQGHCTPYCGAHLKNHPTGAQGTFPMFGEDSFEGAEDGFDETIELEPFDDHFGADFKLSEHYPNSLSMLDVLEDLYIHYDAKMSAELLKLCRAFK